MEFEFEIIDEYWNKEKKQGGNIYMEYRNLQFKAIIVICFREYKMWSYVRMNLLD